MIIDHISNLDTYIPLLSHLRKVVDYLNSQEHASIKLGPLVLKDKEIFGSVSERTLGSSDALPERHDRYVDLHYVINGFEKFEWMPSGPEVVKRIEEKDVCFYSATNRLESLDLPAGYFALFFPQDIHRTNLKATAGDTSRKLMMKIKAD